MENPNTALSRTFRPPFSGAKSIFRLFVAICALLMTGKSAFAQAYTKVDIQFYGYTLLIPDVTLMKGESVEATLLVGNAANLVRDAIGFDFSIELAPNARLAPSLSPSMNGSWLAEPNKMVTESRNMDTPQRYQYRFQRASSVDNGGVVMRLTITSEEDYVRSSQLIRNASGVMQIDNLDLKQATPQPADAAGDHFGYGELTVWPNPASGSAKSSIHLNLANSNVASVAILNLEGRLLASHGAVDAIDMSGYSAGTYLLQVTDQSGKVQYIRQNLF